MGNLILQDWWEFEKRGWSWRVGWNAAHGSYYAQAWRDLKKPVYVEGRLTYRECFTEFAGGITRAEVKLQQRLRGVDGF